MTLTAKEVYELVAINEKSFYWGVREIILGANDVDELEQAIHNAVEEMDKYRNNRQRYATMLVDSGEDDESRTNRKRWW